jgi:hypothetical protein
MEGDIKDIIIRNRKALGICDDSAFEDRIVNRLVVINRQLEIDFIDYYYGETGSECILADGLIVGYGF